MRLRNLYPLITTPHVFAARDFYVRHFGFEPLFQASWFVYLAGKGESGEHGPTLAFMLPSHPSSPPGPESFAGVGMIITIEVADAAAAHRALVDSDAPIVHPLTDEPWGQRRFMTRDPSGALVDVVQLDRAQTRLLGKISPAAVTVFQLTKRLSSRAQCSNPASPLRDGQ